MTRAYLHDPQFKLEISGETFINDEALTILNVRPENNVSFLVLTVGDKDSKNYVDVFDAFDAISLSLRYGSDTWTKVFGGVVLPVSPQKSSRGEVLEVAAWGEGNALVKTHCDESYGVESQRNQTLNTPNEITEDIIDEHVNKAFGGAATGYALTHTECEDVHNAMSVTYLNSPYLDNFTNINRVCDLANAYAAGLPQVSVHWYVDPVKNVYMKKIDADHAKVGGTASDWDEYWGGSQAASTIVVKEDMILYNFKKSPEEYANKIVLSSLFRKPSEDYWTENQKALWGSDANIDLHDENGANLFVVGSYSLRATPNDVNPGGFWYPSAENAGWDLTKIGSEVTPCYLSFYYHQTRNPTFIAWIAIATNYGGGDYWSISTLPSGSIFAQIDEWSHITLPVGPYYGIHIDEAGKEWTKNGNADWADINSIYFRLAGGSNGEHCYIDDLHFSGLVVREAKDTSEITDHDEYQKFIRNDTAVNDTLVAATDTGTAARLAYAELLRRSQTPTVGIVQIPMVVDILPGQTVAIDACEKSDGTYRIDADFRVKEIRHFIGKAARYGGFETQLNLTSDVTNTHAFGAPSMYSLLMQYAGALGHSEARDLKGGAVDNLIPRLSKSY